MLVGTYKYGSWNIFWPRIHTGKSVVIKIASFIEMNDTIRNSIYWKGYIQFHMYNMED